MKRCLGKSARAQLALWSVLFLGACAVSRPLLPPGDAALDRCTALYAALDDAVARSGVHDAQAAAIDGFPYLRVDRFLAALRDQVIDGAGFDAWVERLAALDRAARAVEIANLPPAARAVLPGGAAAVETCALSLRRAVLDRPGNRALLRANAVVPDEYRTAWRVVGLYPLSSLLVARGVGQWHRETHATFARPLTALPVAGTLERYVPREAALPVLGAARRDALGVPVLSAGELETLYARHAPVFEIDQASRADRLGRPHWGEDNLPQVDVADPTVYRHLSFARIRGQVLVQLNYVIWFPERPRSGRFDILGGRLDGITWRVTLGADGRPLLYDAMHNCGCYHMFFPPAPLRLRPGLDAQLEPPLVPQAAPALNDGERIVVRIAHATHYIERVYAAAPARGTVYRFDDLDSLRSLAQSDGHRSLYGPDGIVPGTERAERWLIWPMGVPAPGAMRQWGHHATAFIGRRHFDDPDLLTRLFEGYPE